MRKALPENLISFSADYKMAVINYGRIFFVGFKTKLLQGLEVVDGLVFRVLHRFIAWN